MKTLSTFLADKGITNEAFEAKSKDEQLVLIKDHSTQLESAYKSALEGKMSKEEAAQMKADLDVVREREIKAIQEVNSEQGLAIKSLLENLNGSKAGASEKAQINSFIEENVEKIKSLKSNGHGFVEFTTKDVHTGSVSAPDGTPVNAAYALTSPNNVNLNGTFIDGMTTSFNTSSAAYPYIEAIPAAGDVEFVLEKGSKPEVSLTMEARYAQPVKAAGHMVLSDEAIQDIPGMQSIATDYLRRKHDIARQRGILSGDGTGANPEGILTLCRSFVAGSMAASVDNPNFMDVVNAMVTDIYTTHNFQDEMPYSANLCLVNPVDFYKELVAAKDGNALPLYPMASLFNRVTIGGVTIIPSEEITAGEIFVGDMKSMWVSNYIPYTVRIGWVNDQFITNQFSMVGESRFHAFVKELDKNALVCDTIATVKAAITAS